MAIQMLKNLQSEAQRERCLELLQQACNEEIILLNQMPNIRDFSTPENDNILRQVNLVSNGTNE